MKMGPFLGWFVRGSVRFRLAGEIDPIQYDPPFDSVFKPVLGK